MLERLKGSKPWFVMGAITYLEDEFLEDPYGVLTFRAFEWGCGGSTLWLSQRTKSVVALEHDREWVESTRAELDKYGITNVSLVLKFLDRGYVEYIDTFPDEHFDIIMVDGRRRSDCLRRAIPKLRCGGALVLDNSERAEYQEAMKAIGHWQRRDWDSGYSEGWSTTVWRKPE
jgi:precorrin-6B methylase 2